MKERREVREIMQNVNGNNALIILEACELERIRKEEYERGFAAGKEDAANKAAAANKATAEDAPAGKTPVGAKKTKAKVKAPDGEIVCLRYGEKNV